VGLGVLLSLWLGEGLLRLYLTSQGLTPTCYAASVLMFQPHPVNGFELSPGFRLRSRVLSVSINAVGLRGAEVTPDKPPGTQRVVLLGGSAAFGYFVSDDECAAALVQQRLRARGLTIEVLNGAVPSYDLRQLLVRYQERIRPLQPDVVVLYLGWNDLRQVSSEVEPPPGPPRPSAWERRWAQSSLYGLVRYRLFPPSPQFVPSDSAPLTLTDAGKRRFEERLERLAELVAHTPARLVVCAQAMAAHPDAPADIRRELGASPERQQQLIAWGGYLHETLQQFARRHGAPFVDAYAEIPPTYDYLGDAIHLTPLGEERLAALLEAALTPLLSLKQSPTSRNSADETDRPPSRPPQS
jgi:lysophospholipase L1-like esterase